MKECKYINKVEKWDVLEAEAEGHSDKNPFVDYNIQGVFTHKNEEITVDGFYDGNGIYKVRFMPSFEGLYHFQLKGTFSEETYGGTFTATEPSGNNHGPMRVSYTYHLAYEDATPYFSIGTTCYVWNLQSEELQAQTLETLKNSAFNKIRFCIFPKHYDYNLHEPISYPYEGTPCDSSGLTKENFMEYMGNAPGNNWNFSRFNTSHFALLDKQIRALMSLGIEADIIIMHPYDRWGFSQMNQEQDDLYLNYVVSRLSAYRNVWWSLANEYDLMEKKTLTDWERYAKIICEKDAYKHLRSIHNCHSFYDHARPWITHLSVQRQDVYKSAELVSEWRERYKKPVVLDEIAYEGNIQHGWGNINGKELVRRFWEATCRGGYAGHGETYMHPEGVLWWSHGGELHGDSPERFKFLHKILSEIPGPGLRPVTFKWDEVVATVEATKPMKDYFLFYYGFFRPSFREFYFDDTTEYQVDIIDTWEMTIQEAGIHKGRFTIQLPGKEYMAVRMRKI